MTNALTIILFIRDSVKTDTKYTATGGIQPEYFLGGILFIILIMILMLLIKISNIKQKDLLNKQDN